MFQYARTDMKKKQEKYQKKYDEKMNESLESERMQKRISSFLVLKNRIDFCRKKVSLFGIGLALSLSVFGFLGLLEGLAFIIPLSLTASLSFVALEFKTAYDWMKIDKKTKNEYFDLRDLSDQELRERKKYFADCSFASYHQALEYRDLNRSIELKLNHMNHYEHMVNESQNFLTDPYYLADSKEEYEELIKRKELSSRFDTLLQEYLDQPLDYSTISFDNQISVSIQDTEKTKYLMK